MKGQVPCRVQWVTRPAEMHNLVETMLASGAVLLGRSDYDVATEDLDAVDDAETGPLSIAEFRVGREELERRVAELIGRLGPGETVLLDLCGQRLKVQVLPIAGEHGVIIRKADGVHRLPRTGAGTRRSDDRWLAREFGRAVPA